MSKSAQRSEPGALSFFEYLGAPRSWLNKRPRLPSRNWLIFIGVFSSLTSAYIYDRRQCRRLKEEYIARVRHLAEAPLHPSQLPRKVTVYTAKWPGDDDHLRGAVYFKKYLKPILVAAAVDYVIVSGRRHGELVETVASQIKTQRRRAAKLDPLPPGDEMLGPRFSTSEDRERQALEGGIVIVGRSAFKEYLKGLHLGWTQTIEKMDKEEALADILAEDSVFDEQFLEAETEISSENKPALLKFSPLQFQVPAGPNKRDQKEDIPPEVNAPPSSIPKQPSLLLLPFLNRIGFKQIPMMLVDFFNHRHEVRKGGEAALLLVLGSSATATRQFTTTDLDWEQDAERHYKSSVHKLPTEIESARTSYYKDLSKKLATARSIARGERELSKDEVNFPPPTEVELRAERLKKELRWRNDLQGWEVVKPETPPTWDTRFTDCLSIFEEQSPLPIDYNQT